MRVGYSTRLKTIKDDILARKTLRSADVHYVEELSRSYLQNRKKYSMPNNEKIIIIGTVLVLGLFFVFFIVPLPDNNPTLEKFTPIDSAPEEGSPTPAEVSSNLTEFSSTPVIHSSSSTLT